MTDIKICNNETSDIDGKTITVCNQKSPFKPQDIKICPNDDRIDDGCSNVRPLVLSHSSINIVAGDTISASGGDGNTVFSISCGSIDSETGYVEDVSGCCQITVTAVDGCGQTASLDLRVSGGFYGSPVETCNNNTGNSCGETGSCVCVNNTVHTQETICYYQQCDWDPETYPDLYQCSGCVDLNDYSPCSVDFVNYGCGDGSEVVVIEINISQYECA